MIILLKGYLILFVVGSLLLYAAEIFTPKEDRDPVSETAMDLVTTLILFAGMVLLLLENESQILKRIWLFAAPAAFALQAVLSWKARAKFSGTDKKADAFADVFLILLLIPALVFNLIYSLS